MQYEVWQDIDEGCVGISIFPVDENVEMKRKLNGEEAQLLRIIEAASWEEAMIKHHELMGWNPYIPMEDK